MTVFQIIILCITVAYGEPERRYEVRSESNAVDIQINKESKEDR